MKVAVIGATGLVGQKMLQVLSEQKLPVDEIIVAASEKSVGKKIKYEDKEITIISVDQAVEEIPDIAIFSAGAEVSLQYAKKFAEKGTYVIDNSSAWRKDKEIPLVVPEINASDINVDNHIIANPNCTTICMLMALAPLHKKYNAKRLVISTYQSVSGSGQKGLDQLACEQRGEVSDNPAYPCQIHENVIPHGGNFLDNGYTAEEEKLVFETNKILHSDIAVTATVVRVPVYGGHSESINVEFEHDFDLDEVRDILSKSEGVVVYDNPSENIYPTPVMAYDKDEVFVGRLRRDFSRDKSLNMWLVSDNIRKGAATNAVQIAKYVIENFKK
ncbi:MAG: aspartate-semialdehyde dehydrogenase [Lentimicrobiaceae bacterium]|nr:aspartate-semialdehyde dehydrogenase [Lentimicrobiaceae bacterium]